MKILKLKEEDSKFIEQCDSLFKDFLESEREYDNNYIIREDISSFSNDLKDNNKIIYVAVENERLRGFLYAYISKSKNEKEEVAHLCFLYVDKNYRNKRIASSLIKEFLEYIDSLEIRIVDLKVYNENKIALKLYERFDFKPLWTNLRRNID